MKMDDGVKFCPSCGTPAGGGDAGGAAPAAPKPAAEKVGGIRKCPACGAEVPAMTAVCPSCGHEFSNVRVSSAVNEFFAKLDALDSQMKDTGAAGAVLGMLGMGGNSVEKRKLSLIEGFPVPNTKEDLLEFVITASSRIDTRSSSELGINYQSVQNYNKAWKTKLQQAYSKSRIVLGNDPAAMNQIESIVAEIQKAEKKSKAKYRAIIILCLTGVLVFFGFFGWLIYAGSGAPGAKKETQRLEALYTEIVTDLNNGDLLNAKLKMANFMWSYDYSDLDGNEKTSAHKAIWDPKREALLQEIESLESQTK
jgi:hypothetical protein